MSVHSFLGVEIHEGEHATEWVADVATWQELEQALNVFAAAAGFRPIRVVITVEQVEKIKASLAAAARPLYALSPGEPT